MHESCRRARSACVLQTSTVACLALTVSQTVTLDDWYAFSLEAW